MAKIIRKNQKIFATSAGLNQRAVIGSLSAGVPSYATDPEAIQANSNYLGGLKSVVDADNAPALEDINALYFLFTYQLAYLMQQGVAEWNAETEYFEGSFCSVDGVLYRCLEDGAIGFPPATSGTVWKVATAPDNVGLGNVATRKWEEVAAPVSGQWSKIAFSPSLGRFCCVSLSGATRIMTSNDGLTWTGRTPPNLRPFSSVAWSPTLSLFVAVLSDILGTSICITSPDGITWTERTMPNAFGRNLLDVTWVPSQAAFIAVGYGDTPGATSFLSSDGITWVQQSNPGFALRFNSVCWSEELSLYVAVGMSGAIGTSPDGDTWTQRTSGTAFDLLSVCWSPEKLIFVATGNGSAVLTSSDGVSWGLQTLSPSTFSIQGVTWGEGLGLFLAAAQDSASGFAGLLLTSPDGIAWHRKSAPATPWRGVGYSERFTLFVVSSNSDKVAHSR